MWPKYWSFNFSISPSNEYSEFISFRIDWFDLAVQGTLKSLLQHHSWKASVFWHSVFFMVQLPHPYLTIGKTIALTIWTFVGKVISLQVLASSRSWIQNSAWPSADLRDFSYILLGNPRWKQALWTTCIIMAILPLRIYMLP